MRALILAALLLAGCATTAPGLPKAPATAATCLPLKSYTAAEEQALAAAVATQPAMSPLVEAMADYGAMRAADRACLAAKPNP